MRRSLSISVVKENPERVEGIVAEICGICPRIDHQDDKRGRASEEKAKQAKEETSKTGQDILMKAKDIREMHKHAKEANDMRAGEIYGEKAILATEARELHSWLLSLSDEREKYLSIIEEITVIGYAISGGGHSIKKVDISVDGGKLLT